MSYLVSVCDFELWRSSMFRCASPSPSIRVEFFLFFLREKLALHLFFHVEETLPNHNNNNNRRDHNRPNNNEEECVHLTKPVICIVQTQCVHTAQSFSQRNAERECKRHTRYRQPSIVRFIWFRFFCFCSD